jgi:hypothetical protein
MRTDAEALFVVGLGVGERHLVEPMAAELRLVVREVPPPGGDPLAGDGPAAPGVLAAERSAPAGDEHRRGERFAPVDTRER